MVSSLQALVDEFGLEEQFAIDQADRGRLRCRDCDETVRVECADLHPCVREEA